MKRKEFKDLINKVEDNIMTSVGLCRAFRRSGYDFENKTYIERIDMTLLLCDVLLNRSFWESDIDCFYLGERNGDKELRQMSLRLFEQYFLDEHLYIAL